MIIPTGELIQLANFILVYIVNKNTNIDTKFFHEQLDGPCNYLSLDIYKSTFDIHSNSATDPSKLIKKMDSDYYYLVFNFSSRQKLTKNIQNDILLFPKYYRLETDIDSPIFPLLLLDRKKIVISILEQQVQAKKVEYLNRHEKKHSNSLLQQNNISLENHFWNINQLQKVTDIYNYVKENDLFFYTDIFFNKFNAIKQLKDEVYKESNNYPEHPRDSPFLSSYPKLFPSNSVSDNKKQYISNHNKALETKFSKDEIKQAFQTDQFSSEIGNYIFSEYIINNDSIVSHVALDLKKNLDAKDQKLGLRMFLVLKKELTNPLRTKRNNPILNKVYEYFSDTYKNKYKKYLKS